MCRAYRYYGLLCIFFLHILNGTPEPLTGLVIRDPQLNRFDGTRWLNVSDIIKFRQGIDEILETTLKIKDRAMSIKELVDYHVRHQLPPKLHNKIVQIGVHTFLNKALPHFNAIRRDKALLVRLIDTWAVLREKENSSLKVWGDANINDSEAEIAYFKHHLVTIMQLDEFLEDIKLFLGDLLYSCPKSYAQYLECVRIITEQHEQHNA